MSLVSFLKDSFTEFKDKVEWPKWLQLQSSTTVVSIATILLAIFTFGVDTLFSEAIKNIYTLLIGVFN
ncbi:preprotein translocase subunit SecE [Elizabethkingia argentiflava]|uniref:Protein translocase subunit SecE n=1 Tax=Elizabethkingia argenteiflava TaxID=2681556 RepID=A0A845PVD6_9FLAO|nr:preprotein translocase subunit SecE [Elizabethkingia argenteiflava]NAW50836.1 preprotein translocase subunit SecE [Elizabethkingia argenteiflava]